MQAKKELERTAPAGFCPSITDEEFATFRKLIHGVAGINLSDSKRQLLCSRLGKRLRHHRFRSFSEYYAYLKKHDRDGSELLQMVNCITTNKTHFFREPHHFEFLRDRVLPEIARRGSLNQSRRLRIWSAGCSTGEEPYSIAMAIANHLKPRALWDVKILASDIDTDVLSQAEEGVYALDRLEDVAASERERWFEAVAPEATEFRVKDELRESLIFRRINLIEAAWPIKTHFDVIFCRNVTIYFDRSTQERLYERFARLLRPGGYLIAGHSENLTWLSHLFTPIGKTVYQVRGNLAASKAEAALPGRAPAPAPKKPKVAAPAEMAPHLREVTLMSGGIHVSREPSVVRTLLGSCVAVCLHDPSSRVGGMNHFMLPDTGSSSMVSAAYGVHAMELLINGLMKLGGQRQRMIARVFGAANMLKGSQFDVPQSNARFALEFLEREGIPVLEERLGGDQPVWVKFSTHDGEARIRVVSGERERVAMNDQRHALHVRRDLGRLAPNHVELF